MFQQYARCPWVVESDAGPLDLTAPLASFRAQLGDGPSAAPPEAPKKGKKKKSRGGGGEGGRSGATSPAPGATDAPPDAMVLDRSVEGGLDDVVGLSRSQLVGLDGLVLEVDEGSRGIASVQIFRT